LIRRVLAEVMPHAGRQGKRRDEPSELEVGWTLDRSTLYDGNDRFVADEVEPLDCFPCLHELVLEAMQLLGRGGQDLELHRLNVSCLWYFPGHELPMHCDRPKCFDKEVYGAVICNTSDRALEFHHYKSLQRYVVPEVAGTCFAQRDEARFKWKHGVLPLSEGERLSVTWRWFLPEVEFRPRAMGLQLDVVGVGDRGSFTVVEKRGAEGVVVQLEDGRQVFWQWLPTETPAPTTATARGVDRTLPSWVQALKPEPTVENQLPVDPIASPWEVYIDPESNRKWWWNTLTEEARFDPPE